MGKDAREEPKSWGEAIQNYRHDQQHLTYEPPRCTKDFNSKDAATSGTTSTHLPKVHTNEVKAKTRHPQYGAQDGLIHHTQYTQSRRQAAFNPITQVHLDRSIETNLQRKEKTDMVDKANKGQDRALATETQYNVVNFESKRQGLDAPAKEGPPETKTYIPDTRTNYNILSNLSHEVHHWAPPELRTREPDAANKPVYKSKLIGRQDYNIVSNKYLAQHDEKTHQEENQARQTATEAFWRTHNYDPIEVKYYDEEREDGHWDMVKDAENKQGVAQAENIRMNAPTTHLSEGNLYDPVTCVAKNEDAIKQLHRLEQGKVEFMRSGLERVGEYLSCEDNADEVRAEKNMNRAKWRRFEDEHSHGYDILNNAPHYGRGAKQTHLPKARPDNTMWETINEEALKTLDTTTLSTKDTIAPAAQGHQSQVPVARVPPVKIQPVYVESRGSSARSAGGFSSAPPSGGSFRSAPVSGSRRSSTRSTGSAAAPLPTGASSGRQISASGRVRTGGFQHLSSDRD